MLTGLRGSTFVLGIWFPYYVILEILALYLHIVKLLENNAFYFFFFLLISLRNFIELQYLASFVKM